MRDVHDATKRLAHKKSNEELIVSPSRLSAIENGAVVPTVYRMYSLARVYSIPLADILDWYGIELDSAISSTPSVSLRPNPY